MNPLLFFLKKRKRGMADEDIPDLISEELEEDEEEELGL